MRKRLSVFLLLAMCILTGMAQSKMAHKVTQEKMLERFLTYVRFESQSVIDQKPNSFPMTDGQREIAQYICEEVKNMGGKNVKVTLSDDYYVYIDIPSNIKKKVPSILFMAHLDITPEAPGVGIKPIVHRNYDGGDIHLPGGITLNAAVPGCEHLKDFVGKTIVTSDGTTLLGADDKTGCAILITMVQEIINNPSFKHGRVMVALSQNEDVGKAADRYDPTVFGDKPEIVIDVDGAKYNKYSVANFTAIGQTYEFRGNRVSPSYGKEKRFADALTAAAYFIGLIPPEIHPSVRDGQDGYIQCYYFDHRKDSTNKAIDSDYTLQFRLRFFDQEEGRYQQQLMADNLKKVQEAFPLVDIRKTSDIRQYDNVAYTMPEYLPDLLHKATQAAGIQMTTRHARAGSTSSMMVARYPEAMPGGSDLYSGQNAEHSCYEWACIEELMALVNVTENLISEVVNMK